MFLLAKVAGLLLTPPGLIILVAFLGLLLQLRWRLAGGALVVLAVVMLLVLSLPVTGYYLAHALERSAPVLPSAVAAARAGAGAVVILGGGRIPGAPEYGGDIVSGPTLERLRYGAMLAREARLPILVTGGSPFGEAVPEAELMQRTLREFGVSAAWAEGRSRNTHENAMYSRAILEAAGVKRILLVTHASHMPRALWAFHNAGIDAVPAPMGFTTVDTTPLRFLPSASALSLSSRALGERLGLAWYRLAHRSKDEAAVAPQPAEN